MAPPLAKRRGHPYFHAAFFGVSPLRAKSLLALFSVCIAIASLGCTPAGPPGPEKLPVVQAGGTVTYQGKPVADASVSFQHS